MAQSGFTPIILYHSDTTTNVPTTIVSGELAANTVDGKLFLGTGTNTYKTLLNVGSSTITVGGNVTFSGAFSTTLTVTGTTTGTLPTSGYLISSVTNMAANPVTGTPSSTTYLRGDGTWATIAVQVYPSAGIPNSTGSAWGTSYSTTGSGTVVALATSPSFTTPVLGTPTSGNLSNCTADGTNSVGFLNIPINSQSTAYTLVLSDAGKAILHPSTDANARTFTIPANSSVAYPVGTAISFINMTSQVVSIAITTDTMYLSSAGTTGTRSLAQYGTATAVKMTSTTWIISGSGLT